MKKRFQLNLYSIKGFAFFLVCILILPKTVKLQNEISAPIYEPQGINIERISHPKIESNLYQLLCNYYLGGLAEAKKFAIDHAIDLKGEFVKVIVESNPMTNIYRSSKPIEILSKKIEVLDGIIETTHNNLIQSLLPINSIFSIANSPSIEYVRLPFKASIQATSEGVGVTGANQWHNINSYRSTQQVKICILDLGFQGYNALLGTDLPSSVDTKSFRSDGDIYASELHGTACAEIIHDMAPDAILLLVNFNTAVEFRNAVDWVLNQGVDIIYSGINWRNVGPGDGTGYICEGVIRAHNNEILWVAPAGNDAKQHWEGNYSDPEFDDWCNFEEAGNPLSEWFSFYVYAGDTYSVLLNWDDWGMWNGSNYSGSQGNDYDMTLYNADYIQIGGSWNNQTAGADPVESVSYVADSNGWRYIRIHRVWSNRNCKLELFFLNGYLLEHQVPSGSIASPADSPYAIAVGATDWYTDTFHLYSGQGPTEDGRIKPDYCAPSRVSTVSYGLANFSGTSASAAHLAGALALLKLKTPLNFTQIQKFLEERVLDLGPIGKDNKFGIGRLSLK